MCGLAPLAVAVALAGPMCPRLDRAPSPVMAALIGSGEATVDSRTVVDPAFEAAIRAIKPAPQTRKRRSRR
ncbi:hypothetical protein ACUXK4_004508 [Methylorubrum extorquens]